MLPPFLFPLCIHRRVTLTPYNVSQTLASCSGPSHGSAYGCQTSMSMLSSPSPGGVFLPLTCVPTTYSPHDIQINLEAPFP